MKTKRLLSLLLAVVTLFSMAIIPVSAEDEIQYTESDLHEMTAYADAVAAGHVNRLTAEEAPNTLVFANADNTKTMYYYGEDIKYTDENGNVRDKTNELTYSNGAYVNEDNDINVALPVSLADGVTLTHDDFEITMTPGLTGSGSLSTSPSTALLTSTQRGQADTVTYHSAFGANASIRYTPMYSGIKEDIILSSYTGVYSFSFLVETGGLLLLPDTMLDSDNDSMTEGNMSESIAPPRWYFAYRDDPTTPVAWFSDVYIYDSVGATATGSISVELLDDGRYALTVNADRAFLESSSTVYPVTVDPSVTINYSTIHDATISSYFGTTNYGSTDYLYVGGSHGYYSAMKFMGLQSNSVFSSIPAGQIYSAKLSMYCYEKSTTNPTVIISQYSPTSASSGYWLENNITYNKCGIAYDSTNQVSKTLTSAVQYSFDITNIVKAWKGSTALIEKGLLLRAASSSTYAYFASSEYSGTNLRPYLTINYVSDGIYKIKNVGSGKNLNAYNSRGNVGDNVYQYTDDGTASQAFRIVYNSSSDAYTIHTICNEYGYGNIVATSGSNVQIAASSNGAKWVLQRTSDDIFKIKLSGSSTYMTVGDTSNGSSSNTAVAATGNVYLAASSSSNYQKWELELIDEDGCVELSDLELHSQERDYTCSSACIKMILGYYGINKTETEIYNYQNNNCEPNDFTYTWVVRNTINHYLPDSLEISYEYNTSSNPMSTKSQYYYQILKSLIAGNPVIVMICLNNGQYVYTHTSSHHYIIISGITYVNGEYQLTIYDPWINSDWFSWDGNPVLTCSAENLFDCLVSKLFIYSED